MKRVWWVLVILVLTPVVYGANNWGCCIPDQGICFNGDAFGSQSSFQSACNAQSGEIFGVGSLETCAPLSECQVGCCCAGDDVYNSGQINSDETTLALTQHACIVKNDAGDGTFSWEAKSTTCVEQCGGLIITPPTGNFTVEGTVFNGSTGRPLPDAEVFIPIPDGFINDFSDANGKYVLDNVPEINTRVFGVHPACLPGQTQPMYINNDKEEVDFSLNCNVQSCTLNKPTFQRLALVQGTNEVLITLAIVDTCSNFIQYEVKRCDSSFANCVGLPPSVSPVISDTPPKHDKMYCYKAAARFGDGRTTEASSTSQHCITTGSEECDGYEGAGYWCGTYEGSSAVVTCNDKNQLVGNVCDPGSICSELSGEPLCIPTADCDKCNGLLGIFAKITFRIPIGGLLKDCDNIDACYYDSRVNGNPYIVEGYSSCAGVYECSDYASESVCGDDPCALAAGCGWTSINEELGLGICQGEEETSCDECDDILGFCTREACEAISSNCYFDEDNNGLSETQGCIDKTDMACRYYDTEADCGTTSAEYDILYSDTVTRTDGTNARTVDSDDLFDIGACTWLADRCIKNADMKPNPTEDDCIENNRFFLDQECVRDSTPPVTQFFLNNPPIHGRTAIRSLPYAVYDEHAPVDKIKTHVCFAPQGSTCYPTKTLAQISLPNEGPYTMYFYSIDSSENSEEVQSLDLQIADYGFAALDEVTIVEDDS